MSGALLTKGARAVVVKGKAPYQVLTKTADTTDNAALALANVPIGAAAGGAAMALPVLAGRTYRVQALMVMTTNTAGNGFAFGVTVPAVTTYGGHAAVTILALANPLPTNAVAHARASVSAELYVGSNRPSDGDGVSAYEAIIIPSADGNITLQYAAEAAVGTVTIRKGSVLIVDDITP